MKTLRKKRERIIFEDRRKLFTEIRNLALCMRIDWVAIYQRVANTHIL